MNNKILYIILGVLLIGVMGYYGVFLPCSEIQSNFEKRTKAQDARTSAELALNSAKATYNRAMNQREERKKILEQNKGQLKEIYEFGPLPSYMDIDAVFGRMLHDIINIAKKDGMKVRSMVFYSDIEKEPLVLGRDVSIKSELDALSNKDKPAKDEETPEEAPAVTTDYKAYQVDFGFVSSYSSLNLFIKNLKDYKYLIKVRKLESYPYPENPKILISNVSLILYAKIK